MSALPTTEIVPRDLAQILAETPELQRAYIVGGSVRDWLLGCPVKDCDIEVFGVTRDQLTSALSRWGKIDLVGRSFGVVKLTLPGGPTFDFTIPRRDSKVAPGHKGFAISFDPAITLGEAAARRDFTINALMYDPRCKQVLDFFGGEADLKNLILRHTSPAFVEDPLRVLRGMQFAARFDLHADPATVSLSRSIKNSYSELPVERVREEWFKWASKSRRPSAGLNFLAQTEWIEHFPELQALRGAPQDPGWHPEGDVFTHTAHCCDALVELPSWQQADEETRIVLAFAVLTHDFGKPASTFEAVKDGETRIISPGHEAVSVGLAEKFLARFRTPLAIVERVLPLARNHMTSMNEVTDRGVRRLARRLEPETIEHLCIVMTADAFGRPPRPREEPPLISALLHKAAELEVQSSAPQPILLGRHLLEAGFSPGPELGAILKDAYDAQVEGKFFNLGEAINWLANEFSAKSPAWAARLRAARTRLAGSDSGPPS